MTAHPLAGHDAVDASAKRIRHYRYAEERCMRILGGWIALTPELPVKLLFGRHVWDCAQHADLWGRRLPELRAPAHRSEPPSAAFVGFMDLLGSAEAADQSAERLVGAYEVLKRHLVATYARHLARSNAIYEPPTRRILERCLADERRHLSAAAAVLRHVAGDEASRARAEAWGSRLRARLADAGGVAGDGHVELAGDVEAPPGFEGDVVALGSTFRAERVPADLASAAGEHGRALVAGDLPRAGAQIVDAARAALLDAYAGLGPVTGATLVGAASIGAYRIVKLRLTGPGGTAVAQLEWRPLADGWRVVGGEVVAGPATA
jgi:hypothetical protein